MASLRSVAALSARHIQDMSQATALEPHWGYADRSIPCTNDVGSCEYLDAVYSAHDRGMLYVGILWLTVAGILLVWAVGRQFLAAPRSGVLTTSTTSPTTATAASSRRSSALRIKGTVAALARRYLLPEGARKIFGRTTRLQILILACLTAYLAVWSFVGIRYHTWVTPVKKMPGVHNTRVSLGPWSDRIGVLAYALTPLSILLSQRESLLSIVTGVPYQHFNFLHRWVGYIIYVQGVLHTIGWCIIEGRLYQPQPSVGAEWIAETYMIWGVIALIFITFLVALSTPWAIRLTGYEFFRKSHYVLAMLYVGACFAHWANLSCFMIPSLVLWGLDRGVRFIRTALLHYNYLPAGDDGCSRMGFASAQAVATHFPDAQHGDVVRLDWVHPTGTWSIGQHFYLCFPGGSLWQSHPFTPLSLPSGGGGGGALHSYIFRAKSGETKKIADLVSGRVTKRHAISTDAEGRTTTPVILTGPYGQSTTEHLTPDANVLCIAGGTGITFVLPVLMQLLQRRSPSADRQLTLVWAVRRRDDVDWVKPELAELKRLGRASGLKVKIFVTREKTSAATPTAAATAPKDPEKNLGVVPTTTEKSGEVSSSASSVSGGRARCCSSSSSSSSSDSSSEKVVHVTSTLPQGARGEEGPLPSDVQLDHGEEHRHPDLVATTEEFVGATARGRTVVYASGPGGMLSDLRGVVARLNDGAKVWRGDDRGSVELICDDRLEW
jgi:NAD(P)H-flavin reductase